nr:LysR substrate-binding domain-containing protein [Ramlibacter agri]
MRADAGSVTLGFVPPAGFALLPRLLAAVSGTLPEVYLALREMQTDDQLEALGADRIDLAVVRPFTPRSYVESAVLLREPMVLAIPAGHALAGEGPVALSALAGQAFIEFSPAESRYLYELVAGRLRAEGIAPEVVQSLSHTHTILSLVDSGLGLALVPQSSMRLRFEGVSFRALADGAELHAELHLAWRRGGRNSLAAEVRGAILAGFD